ncbi:hypothetical protein TNCV_1470621 [Trichonephila clavipes]|nr:hypothetical protein TNCV_1470621 [Trichonephila clavipes]
MLQVHITGCPDTFEQIVYVQKAYRDIYGTNLKRLNKIERMTYEQENPWMYTVDEEGLNELGSNGLIDSGVELLAEKLPMREKTHEGVASQGFRI